MIFWRHTVFITAAYFFLMPEAHVFFDFSAVFPENLRGLFSNKKPTSTEHLLCHRLYIIKRVLLKKYIPKYAFVHIFFVWSRAFLPHIVY